jgi:hypothetical protein
VFILVWDRADPCCFSNSVALSIRGFNVFVLFGSVCQSRAGSRRENAPPIIKALKNCSAGKGQGRRIRIRTKRGEGLGQLEWATGSIFFYFLIGIGSSQYMKNAHPPLFN